MFKQWPHGLVTVRLNNLSAKVHRHRTFIRTFIRTSAVKIRCARRRPSSAAVPQRAHQEKLNHWLHIFTLLNHRLHIFTLSFVKRRCSVGLDRSEFALGERTGSAQPVQPRASKGGQLLAPRNCLRVVVVKFVKRERK